MKVSAVNLNNNKISMQQRQPVPVNSDKAPKFYQEHKTLTYSSAVLAAGLGTIWILKNSKHISTLARSIAKSFGNDFNPTKLSSIMSGDELLKTLPKLKKANYEISPSNMQNGIYIADLHSHSNYSDGDGLVKNLLDDAADYADLLHAKTKQKFIYALSDHDTVKGLREAIEIISENPKRYKHVNFIPAIEVSFAHRAEKSNNECEMAELLVYGVNPYSKKLNQFLDNIRQKRLDMVNNFINDASKECPLTEFSFKEFSRFYDFEKYGNVMNIHWRVYHYVQTKHAITRFAADKYKEDKDPNKKVVANNLYAKIMEKCRGASVGLLHDKVLTDKDLHKYNAIRYYNESDNFKKILHKYSPHFENGKLIAPSENTFEEVIEAFKDEKGIFMAFAHPYYYAEHVKNPVEGLKYFVEHSNGLIKASESYHQAYDKSKVPQEEIEKLQKETEKLGLLNLGGNDQHTIQLFDI